MILLHGSRVALERIAAFVLAGTLCAGCRSGGVSPDKERGTPAVASEAPAAPVQASPAPARAERPGEQGAVQLDTTSGKPPEDWPSDVPLYPGGKIQLSMKLGRGSTVTFETPDAMPKVGEWYEAQLASLPQRNAVDSDGRRTLMWSDPSRPLQVTLTLDAADGVTRATLIVVASKAP